MLRSVATVSVVACRIGGDVHRGTDTSSSGSWRLRSVRQGSNLPGATVTQFAVLPEHQPMSSPAHDGAVPSRDTTAPSKLSLATRSVQRAAPGAKQLVPAVFGIFSGNPTSICKVCQQVTEDLPEPLGALGKGTG